MYRLLILGILIISPLPLHAQGQQPDIAKLKADPQRVVSIISGDKAKYLLLLKRLDLDQNALFDRTAILAS